MSELSILSADERPIPGAAVRRLYDNENWWPDRSAADIEAVTRAFPAVGAWRADRLVGFARALTDGRFHAYAEDVVVDPDERGRGTGRALVDRLTELLHPVPLLTLFCGPELVAFYEAAGFRSTSQVILHKPIAD